MRQFRCQLLDPQPIARKIHGGNTRGAYRAADQIEDVGPQKRLTPGKANFIDSQGGAHANDS